MLKIVRHICCGIDVHKKFVIATIASTTKNGLTTYKTKRFSTFNDDLNRLKSWLLEHDCFEVCMESTGKYWIPIFNILEDSIVVTLANPKYVKAIKGKKTDKKDSIWLSDLHRHDLAPGSYIPPKTVRMLRDICRYRTKLVSNRTSEKNRVQNSLTVSNIALSSVLSDTFGKTAQRIIEYVLTCDEFDIEHCKTLIDGRVKADPDEVIRSVLGYNITIDQASKIRIANKHLDFVNECLSDIDDEIAELSKPFQNQIKLLSSIPGVNETSATYIISEIGGDMSAFHSSKHLCSWAGLVPQNNESAGKKKSSKISRAGVYLKPLLVQCANAAIKNNKEPYFQEKYQQIKKRRGHKKAIIAIARMILTCGYQMIKKNENFSPSDYLEAEDLAELSKKREQQNTKKAIALLKKQGYQIIEIEPQNSSENSKSDEVPSSSVSSNSDVVSSSSVSSNSDEVLSSSENSELYKNTEVIDSA
jgi:transposase